MLEGSGRIYLFEVVFGEFTLMPEHVFVITHPYLVEFFRIVGVDSQKFDAFVKGESLVHSLLKHPEVEREPA
jgi:hypothetical protein